MNTNNEHDSYVIPPNFIDSGTFFGGMLKARNAIEAGVLLLAVGIPVFAIGVPLTTKIIILCLTALPLALFALIGIGGESLSSFALIFLRYLRNRRVVGLQQEDGGAAERPAKRKAKPKKQRAKSKQERREDFPAEFDEVARYSRRQRAREKLPHKEGQPSKEKAPRRERAAKEPVRPACLNPVAEYIPIEKIENGIIYTKDRRFVKIIEVEPINFLLRSAREQRNIIYSFISFLKISPVKMQFKVLTKRADINRHLDTVRSELAQETDEGCRMLQEDYLELVKQIGSKEAITRRFFIIFEYEPYANTKRGNEENEAIAALTTAVHTAENYLRQCGNQVIAPENENEFAADVLYNLLCRSASCEKPLPARAKEIVAKYVAAGRTEDLDNIPENEFYAPDSIDFTHGQYIKIDDVYYTYLLVPGDGYKPRVPAGWLSLIVNAGDGIDLDMFLTRQPKERVIQKLGQQLRINRSKIKETSDTNTDFDDLDGAIRSGYFLKEGLGNNEDFYYLNLLITITANTVEELEWRQAEMKKLLLSQDMNVCTCSFREEQAFLSALPLAALEKKLYERSKRNTLTLGAASCYPFTSYEMCDDNGILLGTNKHNNSLIIVDIFNSRTYKNANMAILGTSGAGKTFTLQLMALRMRRKGVQVFILAPLKGHELHRACSNIGGEFIQISPASRNCINIMEIRRADKSVDELLDGPSIEKSELAAKIQKLHIFFSLLIPDMSHEEKQLLDDALIKTYALKGITHDNSSLEDPENYADPGSYREMPVLGDLYDILIQSPDTRRLANILNRLVHGSASVFNQKTNVQLESKYIVLDISELSGDLLTVGMFTALDFVWDKAKENRTQEKAIFIDECWQLIGGTSGGINGAGTSGSRLAAEYVLELAKTIRGYGGGLVCG
ncbi:VirB4 family type IV secretion system protein, partial [Hungatella hathewayi]